MEAAEGVGVGGGDLGALGFGAEDDVDHAADGVAAVERRGGDGEHLDALHEAEGNEIYVGLLAGLAAAGAGDGDFGQPATVDQEDGLFGFVAAEIEVGAAGDGGEVGAGGLLGWTGGGVAVDNLAGEKFAEADRTAARDLLTVVNGVREHVVFGAREIEIAGGDAGSIGALPAVERAEARG